MYLQVCVHIYACVAGVSVHGIYMFGWEYVNIVYAFLFGGSVYMICAPLVEGVCVHVYMYVCLAEGMCTC